MNYLLGGLDLSKKDYNDSDSFDTSDEEEVDAPLPISHSPIRSQAVKLQKSHSSRKLSERRRKMYENGTLL